MLNLPGLHSTIWYDWIKNVRQHIYVWLTFMWHLACKKKQRKSKLWDWNKNSLSRTLFIVIIHNTWLGQRDILRNIYKPFRVHLHATPKCLRLICIRFRKSLGLRRTYHNSWPWNYYLYICIYTCKREGPITRGLGKSHFNVMNSEHNEMWKFNVETILNIAYIVMKMIHNPPKKQKAFIAWIALLVHLSFCKASRAEDAIHASQGNSCRVRGIDSLGRSSRVEMGTKKETMWAMAMAMECIPLPPT